ncbi:MAG: hypothetical protein B6U89_05545 [Desulfurococcales archaeon ex4484_58]|nr:MAG: hypothetical protein B6U89_05545 [Desulfurococcales archaeon ex4484_58]
MLQKLRDRSNLEFFIKKISKLEEESRVLADNLRSGFSGKGRNYIITYHRLGYLPASIAYWFILTMDIDRNVLFNESNAITYYVLPYREKSFLLFYTSNPYTASTINLLQSARVMGYDTLVVTLEPRDERVKSIYSRYNKLYVLREDEIEATLIMSIATYYALSRIYRDKLGVRGKHLYQHVEEGLTPIVEELIDKYLDQLTRIVRNKNVIVTSSKILEPVAIYLVEILRRINLKAYYQSPEQVPSSQYIVLLSTSVEEYLARELMFKYNMMNSTVENMVMNTDPLEAQIYFAILFYYLTTIK